MAPAVLWLDEIEKGFGGTGGQDGGVSQRLLGSLLIWFQEPEEQVFVVATANDVFSDQNVAERIWSICGQPRRADLSRFDDVRRGVQPSG